MIAAPVGFQCPDCVSGASANVIRVKPRSGIGADLPPITRAIIAICIALFVGGNVLGISLFSAEKLAMYPPFIAVDSQWYRLITAAFLHGGWLHIAFNMYALYYLGRELEVFLGARRFIALYLLSALGGTVASYLFSPVQTVSVGASGAIFGLMTALIIAGREMRADTSQVMTLLVVNILIGFASPNIDWRAHFGGAIIGALATSAMMVTAKNGVFRSARIPLREVLSLGVIVLVLIVATLARDAQVLNLLTTS